MKETPELITQLKNRLSYACKTNLSRSKVNSADIILDFFQNDLHEIQYQIKQESWIALIKYCTPLLLDSNPKKLAFCIAEAYQSLENIAFIFTTGKTNRQNIHSGMTILLHDIVDSMLENDPLNIIDFVVKFYHPFCKSEDILEKKFSDQGYLNHSFLVEIFFPILLLKASDIIMNFPNSDAEQKEKISEKLHLLYNSLEEESFLQLVRRFQHIRDVISIIIENFQGHSVLYILNIIHAQVILDKLGNGITKSENFSKFLTIIQIISQSWSNPIYCAQNLIQSFQDVLKDETFESLVSINNKIDNKAIKCFFLLFIFSPIIHKKLSALKASEKVTEDIILLHQLLGNDLYEILPHIFHNFNSYAIETYSKKLNKHQKLSTQLQNLALNVRARENAYEFKLDAFKKITNTKVDLIVDDRLTDELSKLLTQEVFESFCKHNTTYQNLITFNTQLNNKVILHYHLLHELMMKCIVEAFIQSAPSESIRDALYCNPFFSSNYAQYYERTEEEHQTLVTLLLKILIYCKDTKIPKEHVILHLTTLASYDYLCYDGSIVKLTEIVEKIEHKGSIDSLLYHLKSQIIKQEIHTCLFNINDNHSNAANGIKNAIQKWFLDSENLKEGMQVHSLTAFFLILAHEYSLDTSLIEKDIYAQDTVRILKKDYPVIVNFMISYFDIILPQNFNILLPLASVIKQKLLPYLNPLLENCTHQQIVELEEQIRELDSKNIFKQGMYSIFFVWDADLIQPIKLKSNLENIIQDLLMLDLIERGIITTDYEITQLIEERLRYENTVSYNIEKSYFALGGEFNPKNPLVVSAISRAGYQIIATKNSVTAPSEEDRFIYIDNNASPCFKLTSKVRQFLMFAITNLQYPEFQKLLQNIQKKYQFIFPLLNYNSLLFSEDYTDDQYNKYFALLDAGVQILYHSDNTHLENIKHALIEWLYVIAHMSQEEEIEFTSLRSQLNFKIAKSIASNLWLLSDNRKSSLLFQSKEFCNDIIENIREIKTFKMFSMEDDIVRYIHINEIQMLLMEQDDSAEILKRIEECILYSKEHFASNIHNTFIKSFNVFLTFAYLDNKTFEKHIDLFKTLQAHPQIKLLSHKERNIPNLSPQIIKGISYLKSDNKNYALRAKYIINTVLKLNESLRQLIMLLSEDSWDEFLRIMIRNQSLELLESHSIPNTVLAIEIDTLLLSNTSNHFNKLKEFVKIMNGIFGQIWHTMLDFQALIEMLIDSQLESLYKDKVLFLLNSSKLDYSQHYGSIVNTITDAAVLPQVVEILIKAINGSKIDIKVAKTITYWLDLPCDLLFCLPKQSMVDLLITHFNSKDKINKFKSEILLEILKITIPQLISENSAESLEKLKALPKTLQTNYPIYKSSSFEGDFAEALSNMDFSYIAKGVDLDTKRQSYQILLNWKGIKLLNRNFLSEQELVNCIMCSIYNLSSTDPLESKIAKMCLVESGFTKAKIVEFKQAALSKTTLHEKQEMRKLWILPDHSTIDSNNEKFTHRIMKMYKATTFHEVNDIILKSAKFSQEQLSVTLDNLIKRSLEFKDTTIFYLTTFLLNDQNLWRNEEMFQKLFRIILDAKTAITISEEYIHVNNLQNVILHVNGNDVRKERADFLLQFLKVDQRTQVLLKTVSRNTLLSCLNSRNTKISFTITILKEYNALLDLILPIELNAILCLNLDNIEGYLSKLQNVINPLLFAKYLNEAIIEVDLQNQDLAKYQIVLNYINFIPLSNFLLNRISEYEALSRASSNI